MVHLVLMHKLSALCTLQAGQMIAFQLFAAIWQQFILHWNINRSYSYINKDTFWISFKGKRGGREAGGETGREKVQGKRSEETGIGGGKGGKKEK